MREGIAAVEAGVVGLLDADTDRPGDDELVAVLQRLERCARKLGAVSHRLLNETTRRGLPDKHGCSQPGFLVSILRLSGRQARERIQAAADLGVQVTVTGARVRPQYPCTADAERDGDIGSEHIRRIRAILRRMPAAIGEPDREAAEEILAEYARSATPEELDDLGRQLLAVIDPDGTLTDERDRRRRRRFSLGRQGQDLMSPFSGELDPTTRALLDPVLAKWARPGMNNPDDALSPRGDVEDPALDRDALVAAAGRDTRTVGQRNHDALTALLRTALSSGVLGSHRGLPVTAIITMSLAQLERAAGGVVTTASGGWLPIEDALALAERAHPVLALFDHRGRPLHLGRRRLASADQRLALIAADRGCTHPGCAVPAAHSAVHHAALDYAKGGRTDIGDLGLACDRHNGMVDDGPAGWSTRIAADDSAHAGRVEWIPPARLDPIRRPRVNHRHHPDHLLAQAIARNKRQRERDYRPNRRQCDGDRPEPDS